MLLPREIPCAALLLASLLVTPGCGDRPTDTQAAASAEPTRIDPAAGAPTEEQGDAETTNVARVVFLGDSLTAGFGLDEAQAFPALIERRLRELDYEARVINAGVSGDTSAGGLARLDWLLRRPPEILVVGLGANDGLRGLSAEMTEANLRTILERARAAGARPILLGMRLPPNLGATYVENFEAIYPRLASDLDVPLVPFLLEGVAGVESLNLADGIHPNAVGQQRLAETVLPWIRDALESLDS